MVACLSSGGDALAEEGAAGVHEGDFVEGEEGDGFVETLKWVAGRGGAGESELGGRLVGGEGTDNGVLEGEEGGAGGGDLGFGVAGLEGKIKVVAFGEEGGERSGISAHDAGGEEEVVAVAVVAGLAEQSEESCGLGVRLAGKGIVGLPGKARPDDAQRECHGD